MITTAIKQKVTDKLKACIAIANKRYGIDVKFPNVVYQKRGTTAGTANYRTWTIDLNPVLLVENLDDFIEDTVPHELAHLVTNMVYPHAHKRVYGQKRSPHGSEWQSVMRVLGANPSRCHSYDTSNARTRTKASYDYKCNCCGQVIKLGPKRHAQEQRQPGWYNHGGCGRTAGKLTLVTDKAPVATTHTKPAQLPPMNLHNVPAPAPKKAPEAGSKISKCYSMFKQYPGLSRKEMINHFVQLCDCTAAGASTYYATCKKMYDSGVL